MSAEDDPCAAAHGTAPVWRLAPLEAFAFGLRPKRFLERLEREPARRIRLEAGGRSAVVFKDPADIAFVLKTDSGLFDTAEPGRTDPTEVFFGRSVNTARADAWRAQSRFLRPLIRLRRGDPAMERWAAAAGGLVDVVFDGTVPLTRGCERLIVALALGLAADSPRLAAVDTFLEANDRAIGALALAMVASGLPVLGPAVRSRLRTIARTIRKPVTALAGGDGDPPTGILAALLEAAGAPGSPTPYGHDPDHLLDEMTAVLMAGTAGTATTLSAALLHIAADPHLQEVLRREVRAAMPGAVLPPGPPEAMPTLVATVLEAMRLHPTAWVLFKTATQDVTVRGERMRQGERAVVPVHLVHRDPAHWPDPDRFDPARHAGRLNATLSNPAFLGFGRGPRRCPGAEAGLFQLTAILALTLDRYAITGAPARLPERRLDFTARFPSKLRLTFRRLPNHRTDTPPAIAAAA